MQLLSGVVPWLDVSVNIQMQIFRLPTSKERKTGRAPPPEGVAVFHVLRGGAHLIPFWTHTDKMLEFAFDGQFQSYSLLLNMRPCDPPLTFCIHFQQ